MRRNLSYPKEGKDSVRDSNKQLRAQIKRLRKENDMLRRELEGSQKLSKTKKEAIEEEEPREKYEGLVGGEPSKDQWRKEFISKYKKGGKRGE